MLLQRYETSFVHEFKPFKPISNFFHRNRLVEYISKLMGGRSNFHFYLSLNWNSIKQQWRHWLDTAVYVNWSESALFVYVPRKGS